MTILKHYAEKMEQQMSDLYSVNSFGLLHLLDFVFYQV